MVPADLGGGQAAYVCRCEMGPHWQHNMYSRQSIVLVALIERLVTRAIRKLRVLQNLAPLPLSCTFVQLFACFA